MSGFLYFLPNRPVLTALTAEAAGLGYAFAHDTSPAKRGPQPGPGGLRGFIFADAARVAADLVGYWPDRQTWRKIPGGDAWVGITNAQPPTPADLARQDQVSGHPVRLADGRTWLAPAVRRWSDHEGQLQWSYNVPVAMDLDDNGSWTCGAPIPAYRALWETAVRWDDARAAAMAQAAAAGQETARFTFADAAGAAVIALGANYAAGPAEVAMLGLFSDAVTVEILNALIDLPTRIDWVKKNLPPADTAGANTSPGDADSTAATDQP